MTHSDHKRFYSRFLKGHEGKLHFAAHSHHFWPDVTREAQLQYWDDTARMSDDKWNKIFEEVIPHAQGHIARILNLKESSQIAFAPNTHELTTRLLSLFLGKKHLSILTTQSEFHSWKRQINRLEEYSQVEVHTVDTSNLLADRRSVIDELIKNLHKKPDLFFISQVFFDSGLALTSEELIELSEAKSDHTLMAIDGYHGFCALPTDLSKLEGKVFYLAGGYKYAQAGEGAAFMVIPKGDWRPAYTGWYAEFAHLTKPANAQVGYSQDFMAFMGSTQDASGLYRFNATWDLFHTEKLSVSAIHEYIKNLQIQFIQKLPENFTKRWQLTEIFDKNLDSHGHFLTFEAPHEEAAIELQMELKSHKVLIDRRGKRLRFGFGLYHNLKDVETLISCLEILAKNSR